MLPRPSGPSERVGLDLHVGKSGRLQAISQRFGVDELQVLRHDPHVLQLRTTGGQDRRGVALTRLRQLYRSRQAPVQARCAASFLEWSIWAPRRL